MHSGITRVRCHGNNRQRAREVSAPESLYLDMECQQYYSRLAADLRRFR